MSRPKRRRLSTSIYADAYGVSIIVRGKEHRRPIGTPLGDLQRDRRELLEAAGGADARQGTFAADVDAYLLLLREGKRRENARGLLRHWLEAELVLEGGRRVAFGKVSRQALTSVAIAQQLEAWSGRFAPGGLKHLRRELGALYRRLNGKAGANPVADVPPINVVYEEPRAIPYPVIACILAALPDRGRPTGAGKGTRPTVSLTKIRLSVIAYTGLPPAVLARIKPRDLDLGAGTVYARPRRKGKGSAGYTQPLTPQALEAFRQFAAAQAFGPFSTRSASKSWARALRKVRAAWVAKHGAKGAPWPVPDDARPYDLRHSFGTAVMRRRRDSHAVAALLMHSNLQTTRRYLQGMVDESSREAVADVAADLGALPASASSAPARRRRRAS